MPGSPVALRLAFALTFVNHQLFAAGRQVSSFLLLDVVINHRSVGMVGEFQKIGDELYASRAELDQLGIQVRGSSPANTREISLSDVAGLSWSINSQTQTIYLTAASIALKPTMLTFPQLYTPNSLHVESGIGAVLNYDMTYTSALASQGSGNSIAEASLDARLFSPWGVMTSGVIAATNEQPGVGNLSRFPLRRLESTYSFYDPNALHTYRLGDIITGGLSWTRPVRLAGGQISSDFSLRPDLITFPVSTISGQVAVPSSIDVWVNGVELLSRHIQPGPFEIPQLPLVNGTGAVSLEIHGQDGQETRQTLPIYSSNMLLEPGRTSYSFETGVVRLNYAEPDDTYGAPAASASVRAGLLDWLTMEAHAETSGPAAAYGIHTGAGGSAGASAAMTIGRLGSLTFGGATSRFGVRSGCLLAGSFERVSPIVTLGGAIQAASSGYNDIAGVGGDHVPRLQLRATIGVSLGQVGSLGLAFVDIVNGKVDLAQPPAVTLTQPPAMQTGQSAFEAGAVSVPQGQPASLLSVTFNRQVLNGRATIYATGFRDFSGNQASGLSVGFAIPLGSRDVVGASGGIGGNVSGATLQTTRSADAVGDLGWNVLSDSGLDNRQSALLDYKSQIGMVDGGFDRYRGQSIIRGTIQGALVAMDGHIFATNEIQDSFAVVDTTGTSGVSVLQENRPIGRTGYDGLLLVTDLRAFEVNKLSIDPVDIPPDVDIARVERFVRPQRQAGVVVKFPILASRGALLVFVDRYGKAVPVGSLVKLSGNSAVFEVGYDGEAFVTGLTSHNEAILSYLDGSQCKIGFIYRPIAQSIPRLGPFRCVAEFHDR